MNEVRAVAAKLLTAVANIENDIKQMEDAALSFPTCEDDEVRAMLDISEIIAGRGYGDIFEAKDLLREVRCSECPS